MTTKQITARLFKMSMDIKTIYSNLGKSLNFIRQAQEYSQDDSDLYDQLSNISENIISLRGYIDDRYGHITSNS